MPVCGKSRFSLSAMFAVWMSLAACGVVGWALAVAGPGQAGSAAPQQADGKPVVADAESLASRVLVVFHLGVDESREVAEYYISRRGIPTENLCGIRFPTEVTLRGDHYLEQVRAPLRECLNRVGSRKILYIVFSYRTPYKVMISGQRFDASVDSLVADLWDEANRAPLPVQVNLPHPYFAESRSQANLYQPFVPFAAYRNLERSPRIYSVWRLDAASQQLAKGLVDKAIAAEQSGGPKGIGCFDRNTKTLRGTRDRSYAAGEWDIQRASDLASTAGFEVQLDTNHQEFGEAPAAARCEPAALYAGWYSLNNYNDAFTWSDGAIGLHIDSMSAWNMREGTSWVTNAVSRGITVTGGSVSEPYLPNLTRADGMLHNLFMGANVGDAFLRNTRLLKFRIVFVGDPLYRPFPSGRGPLAQGEAPAPSVRVRSPRTLGGVPAVVVVRAGGDQSKARSVNVRVYPPALGSAPDRLRFAPGVDEQELVVATMGVNEPAEISIEVESQGALAAGPVQLLPALVSFMPETVSVVSGEAVELQLRLGATVQSGTAPVDVSSTCPKEVQVPARVLVEAGTDLVTVRAETKAVSREMSCEVVVSKFGASRKAAITLIPSP